MPRPESPEGKWVTVPVRVRESLLYRIDAIRGEHNRSEWMRMAAEITLGVRKPNGDLRAPGATRASLEAAKPRKRPAKPAGAAPRTVAPAPEGVPAAAFQEPVPAKPPRCTHPGTRVIGGFCKTCDALVCAGGGLPDGWVKPEGWKP